VQFAATLNLNDDGGGSPQAVALTSKEHRLNLACHNEGTAAEGCPLFKFALAPRAFGLIVVFFLVPKRSIFSEKVEQQFQRGVQPVLSLYLF
jgi:hypothetical protein